MFVRWKRYARKREKYRKDEPRTLLVATLVQSERRDGKPRHKLVAYLGSIREERMEEERTKKWFWQAADRALEELALPAAERQRIEEALASRVRRPDAAKCESEETAIRLEIARIDAMFGRRR
jgi:hypothetical protein